MDIKDKDEGQIASISVKAATDYLPEVTNFFKKMSVRLGLREKESSKLELMVEEACLNTINYSFDPGEIGEYKVILIRRPGQIVVAVEDQGLPIDVKKLEASDESGLSLILMRALADEVNFYNLGRQGKRVEMIKNLPFKNAEHYVSEEDKIKTIIKAPADEKLVLRMIKPEDSINLARCVYRSYGYSYGIDDIYYPDKIRELINSGLMQSVVAVNPEDEIAGHLALMLDSVDAKVGESGQAVVDPRYRGRGLFKEMKLFLVDKAKDRNMYGLYSEPVTVHPYTQKGNITLGAYETGMMLAYTPQKMVFKDIDYAQRKRHSALIFYLRVGKEPKRDVFPPFHHKSMISAIYERSGLQRDIKRAGQVETDLSIASTAKVDVKAQAYAGRAFMKVVSYGSDLEDLVLYRLEELCLRKMDVIFIDLPMSHPATQRYCASLEMMGFFFSGIIPELGDGDHLRLQYLNNVDISSEKPALFSDFAKDLYAYVLKAHYG